LVSVIVPSYNAGPFLGAQIVALSRQDYAGDVEVVVADNGSRDGSARASAHSPEGVAVRLIDASRRRGPGAARNAGARAARGDFLAFCDADDVVSTTWLRQLVGSASGADLVGGRFEGERLNSPSVRSCYDLADPAAPHLGFLPSASGANLGIWADVFFALGGFDERSRTGEDVALVWKAQLSGYAYVASEALVCKRFPVDLRDAARRFFGYGLGDAWLYRQFRDAGMPRRDRHQTFNLWRALAHGFSGLPREKRHCVWATALALCFGRLAGSARQRVIFT
jgi:glycosyltransferase involved in cell wall biosynthesis